VGIEMNTNCGLITQPIVDGLYRAGLTGLILSYQTPDAETFKTRKAPRLVFDDYREKVRLAVERKVALAARTRLEIDIMNTKYADSYKIVEEEEQALAFVRDWIEFAQGLERKYGLAPRTHDWEAIRARNFLDQDENGSRYTILDGVELIWKRCHSWGNVVGERHVVEVKDTYCPAPYDQFVIQWNGDVTTCCTDYEGRTKTANVFATGIEAIWKGETLKQRKKDMLEGRLLDVCAKCQGVK
jgi:radical SAM protein with 4Fe4S-binding SPASM domain